MKAIALALVLACSESGPEETPPPEAPTPAAPATPTVEISRSDRSVLSFAAVPTQQLSTERLSRFRNPVASGAPIRAAWSDAQECAESSKGRACVLPVPGHETLVVGEDDQATELFTLGSSGAFSVVAINASGRHLAYGLRYDKLEGQPVKLFLVDLRRIREPATPVDTAVRVLTRGVLGPDGPPDAATQAAVRAEHNPLDGQVAAFCRIPVRLRADDPTTRPPAAAYHFPCHLPASTAAQAGSAPLPLTLADPDFGPIDLRMTGVVDPTGAAGG